jgi:chemotaxis protein MotB
MTTRLLAASLLVAAASLTFTGCGSTRDLDHKSVEAKEAQKRIDELERLLADCESGKTSQSIKASQASGEADTVGADQDAVGKNAKVSTRGKEIVITIENSVLFSPGKAELSSQAKATLAKVATLLKEKYGDHDFRVEGHTDDQKITRTKNEWDDNWDLAGGRARAVLHYLLGRGLPAKQAGFAGYADQRPVAANSSDANRAKNRRVEIIVLDK